MHLLAVHKLVKVLVVGQPVRSDAPMYLYSIQIARIADVVPPILDNRALSSTLKRYWHDFKSMN